MTTDGGTPERPGEGALSPMDRLLLETLPTVTLTGTFGGPGSLMPQPDGRENPPPDPRAAEHRAELERLVNPSTPRNRRASTTPKPRHLHAVPPTAA